MSTLPAASAPPPAAAAPAATPGTTPQATPGDGQGATPPVTTPPAAPAADGTQPTTPPAQPSEPAKKEGETPPPAEAELALKLPEGFVMDEALMAQFKPLAKGLGLDSPKAQQLVDLFVGAQAAQAKQAADAFDAQQKQWAETVKADPELGGAKLKDSVAMAQKAIQEFGGPTLRKALDELAIGDHPELVRTFARIGKALAEDSISGSSGAATGSSNEEARLRLAYPSMFPKE